MKRKSKAFRSVLKPEKEKDPNPTTPKQRKHLKQGSNQAKNERGKDIKTPKTKKAIKTLKKGSK